MNSIIKYTFISIVSLAFITSGNAAKLENHSFGIHLNSKEVSIKYVSNKYAIDSTKTDSLSMILLNDGTDLIGIVKSQDMREVTVQLTDGRLVIIPAYTIKKIQPIERNQKVGGNIYYPNPHPSRYLYTPTAYPIKKGESYFQSVYFLSLQFQYGITDNFSAGVGTSIIGLPLTATLKYSLTASENLAFSLGAQAGNLSWASPKNYLGIGFANATLGHEEKHITASLGYGMVSLENTRDSWDNINQKPITINEGRDNNGRLILGLAGNIRTGKNVSFQTEFYYIPEEEILFGGPSWRIYNNKKATWDIGVWYIANPGQNFAVPVFSLAYKIE